MLFLKLLKTESSHIFISYIHLVIKNRHHLPSNTSLIKALLSFSLSTPYPLEPVVFKLHCAADLPTEPVKIFTGNPPSQRFPFTIKGRGLITWITTTWEFEKYWLELLLDPLTWAQVVVHSFHLLQRSYRARFKVLTINRQATDWEENITHKFEKGLESSIYKEFMQFNKQE